MEDNKLIVRMKKKDYITCSICTIGLLAVFLIINSNDSIPILMWISGSIISIIFILFQILYWFNYIEFKNDSFECHDLFKKKHFKISEIAQLKMEYPSYAKDGILCLYDSYGRKIYELTKYMHNFDSVIPYIQKYKDIELITGETERLNDCFKECLIIKLNKLSLLYIYLFGFFILFIIIGLIYIMIFEDVLYLIFVGITLLIFSIIPGLLIFVRIKRDILLYKNFELLLTKDKCYVIDELNRKTEFHLNEINIIKIRYIYRSGYYLTIQLSNKFKLPNIRYDRRYDNVKLVIPFVEKHLNKVISVNEIL